MKMGIEADLTALRQKQIEQDVLPPLEFQSALPDLHQSHGLSGLNL